MGEQILKGIPREDAIWPENVETLQLFLCADFVYLVHDVKGLVKMAALTAFLCDFLKFI